MQLAPNYDPVRFLIVDDDEVSILSIQRTIKKLNLMNPVSVAHDGVEALEILRGACEEDGSLPPFIVTLDLSMPRMTGFEFLDVMRNDPVLKRAIVFVLTHSDAQDDVNTAYDNHVAGYIVKGNEHASFEEALELLGIYSKVVVLPRS